MSKSEKTPKAFSFSVIAAILILSNAVSLGVVARWFIKFLPTLPGSSSNDHGVIYCLSAVGIMFSVLVLLGALTLRRAPINRKFWGIIIVVFSILSVITGGGFIIGFILGVIGGATALSQKPEMQQKANGQLNK